MPPQITSETLVATIRPRRRQRAHRIPPARDSNEGRQRISRISGPDDRSRRVRGGDQLGDRIDGAVRGPRHGPLECVHEPRRGVAHGRRGKVGHGPALRGDRPPRTGQAQAAADFRAVLHVWGRHGCGRAGLALAPVLRAERRNPQDGTDRVSAGLVRADRPGDLGAAQLLHDRVALAHRHRRVDDARLAYRPFRAGLCHVPADGRCRGAAVPHGACGRGRYDGSRGLVQRTGDVAHQGLLHGRRARHLLRDDLYRASQHQRGHTWQTNAHHPHPVRGPDALHGRSGPRDADHGLIRPRPGGDRYGHAVHGNPGQPLWRCVHHGGQPAATGQRHLAELGARPECDGGGPRQPLRLLLQFPSRAHVRGGRHRVHPHVHETEAEEA